MPAIGGSYYRDHLPPLVLKQKKSQSGFTTVDKVIVEITRKQLEELYSGHGEWNADMAKVGVLLLCFSYSLFDFCFLHPQCALKPLLLID